ncbi:BACON domain-containing protein [Dysgonomonas reticulitermitis]
MKTIFNISIFAAILCLFISCKDDDPSDAFIVRGEKEVSISKDGGTISIPISTTVAYSVTPSDPWCTISGKNAIGFDIIVEFNESIEPRSTNIVVAAPDFDPVTVVVTQEKGIPFFNIEENQKNKVFDKTGGTLTVAFSSNLDYTVTAVDDWCEISDKTKNSFKITAEENSSVKRSTTLTIKANGVPDIIIKVAQSGDNILKNGNFVDGFTHWTMSGTPNTFEITNYTINGASAKTVSRTWAVRLSDFEARLVQEVTGIPDGTYTLSCKATGAANDFDLIFIDKDGVETRKSVALAGMGDYSMDVNVVGGKCSVGFRVKGYKDVGLWWNTTYFRFE